MSNAALLVEALRQALGEDAVTSCLEIPDGDDRTARSLTGLDLGTPLAWVRPRCTEDCVLLVRAAREAGAHIAIVGEATTFWDGLRPGGCIALDTRALTGGLEIDADRRLAWAGAGRTVREVDRAARGKGLALAAYPDAAGDTPVGSMLAVGCTAGLGLGRAIPVEQITAATVVTGDGEVLRLGASHGLGSAAFARHGFPDLLGLFEAAEGTAGIVTEVGLALVPAGYSATGRACGRGTAFPHIELSRAARAARWGLDRGIVETFRFEVGADGQGGDVGWEVFYRVYSLRSASDAAAEGKEMAGQLERAGFREVAMHVESENGRRGESPDYDARYAIPPGQHRTRLAGGAFWGAEVALGWGPELAAGVERLARLFDEASSLDVVHRRFGVYPAPHAVSAGVQVLGRRQPAAVEALRDLIRRALPDLVACGGVPYRRGNLWSPVLEARAVAAATSRVLSALDPFGVLPGPRGTGVC
jgi:FAD/FMN-containing dehydrogenase